MFRPHLACSQTTPGSPSLQCWRTICGAGDRTHCVVSLTIGRLFWKNISIIGPQVPLCREFYSWKRCPWTPQVLSASLPSSTFLDEWSRRPERNKSYRCHRGSIDLRTKERCSEVQYRKVRVYKVKWGVVQWVAISAVRCSVVRCSAVGCEEMRCYKVQWDAV